LAANTGKRHGNMHDTSMPYYHSEHIAAVPNHHPRLDLDAANPLLPKYFSFIKRGKKELINNEEKQEAGRKKTPQPPCPSRLKTYTLSSTESSRRDPP
jgi:hypothetical protein